MTQLAYRSVYCSIWDDDKFRALPDESQLVWFHLFTNAYSTRIGLYKMPIAGLAAEKGTSFERYRERLRNLEKAGLVVVDENRHLIWFPKYFEWNRPDNPNTLKKWCKAFAGIPDCSLKYQCIQALGEYCREWGEGFEAAFSAIFSNVPVNVPGNVDGNPPRTGKGKGKGIGNDSSTPDGVDGERTGSAFSLNGLPDAKTTRCPTGKIIELYHRILPMCPPIKDPESLVPNLRARWRESTQRQDLGWWRDWFEYIRDECPFLIGQEHDPNKLPFNKGLRWFVVRGNFAKINEGHYDKKAKRRAGNG